MKFAWDVSEAGFCPDVGRAIWGDSPSEITPRYLNQRTFEGVSQTHRTNYTPEYERVSNPVNPVSHTYAPQIIREGNSGNAASSSWKNTLCFTVGLIAVLLTINFVAPDLVAALVDLAIDKLGAL